MEPPCLLRPRRLTGRRSGPTSVTMFPAFFRGRRLLAGLNVAGVGLSLASLAGLLLGPVLSSGAGVSAGVTGMVATSLLTGTLSAGLLRWRRTVGGSRLRWGWLLTLPLAWLTSWLALVVSLGLTSGLPSAVELLFLVAGTLTFGIILWVPAWLASLVLFGVPIARSQQLASRGLAGEERGERIVATTVAVLSSLALAGTWTQAGVWSRATAPQGALALLTATGMVALLSGLSAALLAWRRESRRRALVDAAEQGRAPGYRVDATADGKVLVRLAAPAAAEHGYRHADIDAEFYALDEQGRARHSLRRSLESTP